jgi:hypothetical protein
MFVPERNFSPGIVFVDMARGYTREEHLTAIRMPLPYSQI